MDAPAPIIHLAGAGDRQSFAGGGVHTWKLLADDTGGAFFLFEDVMTKHKATPLHCHPEADETVYVLDGEILVQIDDTQTSITAGGMTFTPRGTPHAFVVVSDVARVLTMQTPGIGQAFYRDASEPVVESTTTAGLDLARLRSSAVANPRGIEIMGPPPFGAPADRVA